MYILHLEVYDPRLMKYKIYEWELTDEEFEVLMDFYKGVFDRYGRLWRPIGELREFLRPIWQRELPEVPLETFIAWTIMCIEQGWYEWRVPVKMVRMQVAVMYYYTEQKRRTPNPFCECRAWTIVPEELATSELLDELRTEAWYIGSLFGSLYDCWRAGQMDKVRESEEEEPSVRIVREGWEIREVEETEEEIQRAVAFYKEHYNTWDNPAYFYDEELIRTMESVLFPCLREEGWHIPRFKRWVREEFKTAAALLDEGDYEEAVRHIDEVYWWTGRCGVLYMPVGGRR